MSIFGKSPEELVYQLIADQNPKFVERNVTLDKLSFAVPSNIGGGTDDDMYTRLNTTLKVSGKNPEVVMGTVSITYRRLFMDQIFKSVTASVDGSSAQRSVDLLPLLEAKYGLVIPTTDVKDNAITSGVDRVTLTFNGSSLAWIGSLDVYLKDVPADAVDLTRIMTQTQFEGLVYEEPTTE
jgi:hypothetical protein